MTRPSAKEDTFYAAMRARDHRFDGKFFVGVKTTGIYCRPICPAQPKRENVEFFPTRHGAERAGYRPCLRCRPEAAPQSPAWIGKSAVVRRALNLVQDTLKINEEEFAARFGLSARHLRRLFMEEIGKTPKQLSFENRLNLARKLLHETPLPVTEIAFAAGFHSVRRFNDAFLLRFHRPPSRGRRLPTKNTLTLSLPYRPPFDFTSLLHFYRSHRVGELEWFEGEEMCRVVEHAGALGTLRFRDDPANSCVRMEVDFPHTNAIHSFLSRARALFDLDSDPIVIANQLEKNPRLKKMLKRHPGIRLPSGWDGFEVAVGAILGQVVSVERGRALVAGLTERLGREVEAQGRRVKLFPTPAAIAGANLSFLPTTTSRKHALREFARLVASGELSLSPAQDIDAFMNRALKIRGIGPWTAEYIALKSLRHTDAFPSTDLVLARSLARPPAITLNEMRPWRGYVAALLWRNETGEKK